MAEALPSPMLARAVERIPEFGATPGGYSYEPKWDGFRGIVRVGPDGEIEIGSRGSKPLTRYFPELLAAFAGQLPPCTLDGEIVLQTGPDGSRRLDWEALSQRIHPAASRIAQLSAATPAMFVAFDLLALGDDDLTGLPFRERRAALERLASDWAHPLHLCQSTADAGAAERWLHEFEGAGLDGVIARPLDAPYAAGKRTLLKIKHVRSADVVLTGYRMHSAGKGVGSLLLGLYDDAGELRAVGGASAFTDARRRELIEELEPLVERDSSGAVVTGEGERNRFNSGKDTAFVRLRPERVLEVRYDQLEGDRFRHTVQFLRWRPDRDAASCTFDQLQRPSAYDLARVLV